MSQCCGSTADAPAALPPPPPWQCGVIETAAGLVPQIHTRLRVADQLGAILVRCNWGRQNYRIPPGLYAVGAPDAAAPVLVTANYKLSFDRLRQELGGLDLWLLVLDTAGINVWCAAGKGSFGTAEIVRQVAATRLPEIVNHRHLILPQLGAPGVAAHEVDRLCGFRVFYGPVRARDLPAYLKNNRQATPEMRQVRFDLGDRLAVVPVELALWFKYWLLLVAALAVVARWRGGDWGRSLEILLLTAAGYLGGGVLTPALLPWLPGRAFALKGLWSGLALAAALPWLPGADARTGWEWAAWGLLLPTISSFMGLQFTGTTTFTSPSGVKRELRFALPAQLLALLAGVTLFAIAAAKGS